MARFLTTYLRSGGRDSETVTAKLATANSLQVGRALPAGGQQAVMQPGGTPLPEEDWPPPWWRCHMQSKA